MNLAPARLALLALVCAAPWAAASATPATDAYHAGDYATAMREWKLEAERGSASAMFNLGLLHHQGLGTAEDHAVAAEWYLRAADAGFARAMFAIAGLYEQGDGVERDLLEAYKWFELARQRDYPGAKKGRKRVAAQMTPTEIAHADLAAREWAREAKERAAGE